MVLFEQHDALAGDRGGLCCGKARGSGADDCDFGEDCALVVFVFIRPRIQLADAFEQLHGHALGDFHPRCREHGFIVFAFDHYEGVRLFRTG